MSHAVNSHYTSLLRVVQYSPNFRCSFRSWNGTAECPMKRHTRSRRDARKSIRIPPIFLHVSFTKFNKFFFVFVLFDTEIPYKLIFRCDFEKLLASCLVFDSSLLMSSSFFRCDQPGHFIRRALLNLLLHYPQRISTNCLDCRLIRRLLVFYL